MECIQEPVRDARHCCFPECLEERYRTVSPIVFEEWDDHSEFEAVCAGPVDDCVYEADKMGQGRVWEV